MNILGIAAEYISANTVCYIGGSSDWLPLITILDIYLPIDNCGVSLEDADYGDFITLYKLQHLEDRSERYHSDV